MAYSEEFLASSIIVLGNFNPAIFSPDWFEGNDLIGAEDADIARDPDQGDKVIIANQVAKFGTNLFAIQVLENQLQLSSKGVLTPAFKDVAVGIFQLLSHTPVTAVGLNFESHYKLESQEQAHLVGDALAPKEIWNSLYSDEYSGLANLSILIQHGSREEPVSANNKKQITVQPSQRVRYGVNLKINNHFDIVQEAEDVTPAENLAQVIDSQWEECLKDSNRVFTQILDMALATK